MVLGFQVSLKPEDQVSLKPEVSSFLETRVLSGVWGAGSGFRIERCGLGDLGLELDSRMGPNALDWDGRCKATWKREFELSWRDAGPPNHHDDKVDSVQ